MPASTPIYGLPYQVGSDPPCFGPGTGCDNLESIWCDFAALVEAQLDAVDDVVARTATSIPMAGVSLTFPAGQPDPSALPPAGQIIPFDTVMFDTDNMVVQDTDGFFITPRRNGVYLVAVNIFFRAPTGGASMLVMIDDYTVPMLSASSYTTTIAQNKMTGSQLIRYTDTSPLPRRIKVEFVDGFSATSELFQAKLCAYWTSDN